MPLSPHTTLTDKRKDRRTPTAKLTPAGSSWWRGDGGAPGSNLVQTLPTLRVSAIPPAAELLSWCWWKKKYSQIFNRFQQFWPTDGARQQVVPVKPTIRPMIPDSNGTKVCCRHDQQMIGCCSLETRQHIYALPLGTPKWFLSAPA